MLLQKKNKKKKTTSNHLSLSPSPSVSTFQFSLDSIYLSHQPVYLPNIVLFFLLQFVLTVFQRLFVFLCFVIVVCFFLFLSLFSLVFRFYCCYFLLRLTFCQRNEIVRPPYIVRFFHLYELIAYKPQLVDEHITILCIFISS